jgi:4'-phosphopantetheinyl transferase
MQRKCVEQCLGMAWENIEIKRTKGRKPFLANAREKPNHMPNFNYNVSHEGDYIVLASEPVCMAGVDIAAPGQSRKSKGAGFNLDEIFSSFRDQFTPFEWGNIRNLPDQQSQEDAFRRNWSCKEAFTKARGDGIGFDLNRCEFVIKENPSEGLSDCASGSA